MSAQIWDMFMEALLEENPNFSRRPSQEDLVKAIVGTLTAGSLEYLVAKAGTGTGKSLASVIPALGHLKASGQKLPVIVSTASKNLQGQYFNKDLPEMARYFSAPGSGDRKGFTYALLKGKSNYLCRAKLNDGKETEREVPRPKLLKIREIAEEAYDISSLPFPLSWQESRALTTTADACPGISRCPAVDKDNPCFYEKAKDRAMSSDVVVINHAVLAIDAKIRARSAGRATLLPPPGVMVVDECHKLPGYVRNALSWWMSVDYLFRFANEILEDEDSLADFKKYVVNLFESLAHKKDKDKQHIVRRDRLAGNKNIQAMVELVTASRQLWLEEAMESRDPASWRNASRCENLIADLMVALSPAPNDNFWTELDKMDRPVLYYQPKDVSAFMEKYVWPRSSAILMSATPGNINDMGLPATANTFITPSPFDYKNNSRIYVPQAISGQEPYDEHEKEQWEYRRNETIFKLLEASQGRALLLFSSWRDLNRTYDAIAPQISKFVTVLRQTKDNEVERDGLAKKFKEDEHSVLFGTESFFEGVDIPGQSLQLVIIAKLPFPSMIDVTRGGKLDFNSEMLPEMKLKLEQAAGRLIRTTTDTGLVAVLDNRLLTKGYGKTILNKMPPFHQAPLFTSLAEAARYLESLDDNED